MKRILLGTFAVIVLGVPLQTFATSRTLIDSDLGMVLLNPTVPWSTIGAYVALPYAYNTFSMMDPNAIKVYHGLFAFAGPADQHGISFFPYNELQAYQQDEVAAGRNPLLITATYNGAQEPVLWDVDGNTLDNAKQAINIGDPRYVRFFANEYARKVMLSPLYPSVSTSPTYPNSWFSSDEASFNYSNFTVADASGNPVTTPIVWDAPFPQNNTQYILGIESFLTQLKQIAPDVKFIVNEGSMADESVTDGSPTNFAAVYGKMDGIFKESFLDIDPSQIPYDRNSMESDFTDMSWLLSQGKTVILRQPTDDSAAQNETAAVAYLILKDGNSYFSEGYGSSEEVDPSNYMPMFNALGNPLGPYQMQSFSTTNPGMVIYSRAYEGGMVYLNWSGTTQIVTLPTGQTFYSQTGAPVTSLTIPDVTGTYVTMQPGTRVAEPTVYPPTTGTTITGPVTVTLSDATAGAQIYYTTDGTIPTASSTLYTGPFAINANTTITTNASLSGDLTSFEKTASYSVTSANPTVQFVLANDSSTPFFTNTYAAVQLNHPSALPVTINYSVSAASGVTFSPSTGSITFQPFETAKAFPIQAALSPGITSPKNVVATMTSAGNATIGTNNTYTYTIVPNAPTVTDTYFLNLHPSANADILPASTNNNSSLYDTGAYGNGNYARSLWKFDLSSIPASATIQSAVITAYVPTYQDVGNINIPLSAYRMLTGWTQSGATWANSGGVATNFASTPSAINTSVYPASNFDSPTSPTYATFGRWNVGQDVQNMITGKEPNDGWVMIGPESSTAAEWVRWYSNNYKDSNGNGVSGPQTSLLVTYTLSSAPPPDTTPPTISLTGPANNATVSGSVTVTATASDNVGVTSVQFKLDGANLGAPVTNPPYQVSWNTIGISNGTHTLSAIASDAAGNQGTAAIVTVTVNNVVAPAITSALSASATVGSPFSYTITGSNNPTSYSATGLPSGLSINTSTGLISGSPASAGTSNIVIGATNSGGTGTATLVLTVSNAIDTQPPSIPQNLALTAKTTSTISLSWNASTDNFAVAGYKIYRCTGSSCTPIQIASTTKTAFTDTNLSPATTYTYTVSAYDAAGNNSAQSAALNVTTLFVDTTPPTATVTSPANNATVSGSVTVDTTATDNVGVVKVELYLDGALEASTTTAPYDFPLNTALLSNGSHILETKAYDAAGNVGPSSIVSVTVLNIPETLSASLLASPLSGSIPLSVSLTASAGGTAQGTINYIFYCNRADTGTNITSPADLMLNAVTSTAYLAANLCSYETAGTYTPKVIIERGTAPIAQAQQTILVTNPIISTSTPSSTPLISSVTVGEITDTSAQATIVTSASSSVRVNYGTSTGYGNTTLASPELSTVFVNLTDLTQNTNYDFDVVAIPQGSTTQVTSQNFVFTTQPTQTSGGGGGSGGGTSGGGGGGSSGGGGGGSVQPFTVSAFVTTSTPMSAKVTVTTSIAATTQLFYGTTLSYGSTTLASLPLATAYFDLPGLTPGTIYHLKAVSLASGMTESSPDITFTSGESGGSATPSPSSPALFPPLTKNLSIGSTGPEVTELQTLLVTWGYLTVTPTGYYGLLTKNAVSVFQKTHGISPIGSVGPLTLAVLNGLIGTATPPTTKPTIPTSANGEITENLAPGDSGLQVTLLQQILTSDGDYTGPVTGYYGSLTETGVKTFQAKYGIISYGTPGATGYGAVGPKTRAKINNL